MKILLFFLLLITFKVNAQSKDSIPVKRFYDVGNKHYIIEYRYVPDTLKGHAHYISSISLIGYRGNMQFVIGRIRGIYSRVECPADSAVIWYRKLIK